jgi:hypothetical protein
MAKRTLRRIPADSPPPPKKTERPGATSCGCGKTSIEPEGEQLVIRGGGWLKESQWVVCGGCQEALRYSPMIVWETDSGARYTTREYVRGGDARKVSDADPARRTSAGRSRPSSKRG